MLLRLLAVASLVLLPGAWLTFQWSLDIPFWARLTTGIILTPLVICVQFYALRFLGARFEITSFLLVAVNLPAAYLIYGQSRRFSFPDRRTTSAAAILLMLIVASLAPRLLNPQSRVYSPHAWMHADTVYMIANGQLAPEEAELAGVRLAYPWVGHVFPAVFSYLLDAPPVSSFIWINLVWLVLICALSIGLTTELGGKPFTAVASVVWLLFGVNWIGYVLKLSAPSWVVRTFPIWGDYRYTPWVLKFLSFNQMPFALGMFSALVYLTVRRKAGGFTACYPAVQCLLVLGIGCIYPILFPPAAAVIVAAMTTELVDGWAARVIPYKRLTALGVVLLVACVVTIAHLKFVTSDRVTASVLLDPLRTVVRKCAEAVVVTLPLLIGIAVCFRRRRRENRRAIFLLALASLASYFSYGVFHIPNYRNEYKYIFTAAICLAPFPALAMERFIEQPGKKPLLLFACLALILAGPYAHKMYRGWPLIPAHGDPAALDHFRMTMVAKDRFSRLCEAIRNRTIPDTILLLDNPEQYFPILAERTLYAPPEGSKAYPGVSLSVKGRLLDLKGYDPRILKQRRHTLEEIFTPGEGEVRDQALCQVLRLHRPVAIVADGLRDAEFAHWVSGIPQIRRIYDEDDFSVWTLEPAQAHGLQSKSEDPASILGGSCFH